MADSIVMESPTGAACFLGLGLGLVLHYGYFIHGEHHRNPWRLVGTVLLACIGPVVLLYHHNFSYPVAVNLVTLSFFSFLISIFSSILFYRVFLHPLKAFPGPPLARLSKFWHIWLVRKSDNYRQLHELHKQYGRIVRIGPNELSIYDPEAFEIILGPRSKCTKAPWYDVGLPLVSMHMTRSRVVHDERRVIWNRAFSSQALKNYESKILQHTYQLVSQISSTDSKPVDITQWLTYLGFDIMGDLAFSHDFGMVETGTKDPGVELLHRGQSPFGILFPAPWLFLLLSKVPMLAADFHRFTRWCEDILENRCHKLPAVPDIMSYLIGDEAPNKAKHAGTIEQWGQQWAWRCADSRLLVVAGSDTAGAALIFTCFELARHQQHIKKIREELAALGISNTNVSVNDLSSCEHLNAVIDESLRLHPPTPGSLLRVTPDTGITIAGTFIPGDVTVGVPAYSNHRNPLAFCEPDKFIPERWTSNPDLILDKKSYAPFSLGPYACVGKQLALMEIRIVITLLILNFDICLADGEDGQTLLEESVDVFTMRLASLWLRFSPCKA